MTSDVKKLYLVRHGNTFEGGETPRYVGAGSDLSLTDFGLEQSRAVGRFLKKQVGKVDKIFFGPLKRQEESALAIAAELGVSNIDLKKWNDLTEIHYGAWEGLTTDAIKSKWPKEYNSWTELGSWANGVFKDSEEDTQERLYNCFENLMDEVQDNDVIVAVTSNGCLRFLHAAIMGEIVLSSPGKSKVATGSLCEIAVTEDEIAVVKWNYKPE